MIVAILSNEVKFDSYIVFQVQKPVINYGNVIPVYNVHTLYLYCMSWSHS